MKLRYGTIIVGSLSGLTCDMNREGGKLDLLPVSQREVSKLSDQVFEWVEINSRLEELELELNDEEYEINSEVEKLWDRHSQLPNFDSDNCWNLYDEESGRAEIISSPRFCGEGAGWRFNVPDAKKKTKDFSGAIGLFIGMVLVAIWAYIKYG